LQVLAGDEFALAQLRIKTSWTSVRDDSFCRTFLGFVPSIDGSSRFLRQDPFQNPAEQKLVDSIIDAFDTAIGEQGNWGLVCNTRTRR
jgi:hypothetical protein